MLPDCAKTSQTLLVTFLEVPVGYSSSYNPFAVLMYRFQNGRVLRENLSLMTLFLNKQPKQLEVIREELHVGSVIDFDTCVFDRAYEFATREQYVWEPHDRFSPKVQNKSISK